MGVNHNFHHRHVSTNFEHLKKSFTKEVFSIQKPLRMIIASMAVYMFGWGFADPFISVYLSTFADDYSTIGDYHSYGSIAALFVLFFIAELIERTRADKMLNTIKIAYAFVGLFYFIAGMTQSLQILIPTIIAHGILASSVWSTAGALMREIARPKEVNLTWGLYHASRNLAFVCGIAIALLIVSRLPIYYIFVPIIIFPPVSILFTKNIDSGVQKEPFASAVKDIIVKDKLIMRFLYDLKEMKKEIWFIYFMQFFHNAIYAVMYTFLPLFAVSLGYGIVGIGTLVLISHIPFLLSFVAAEIADSSERMMNIVIGFAISTTGFFLLSVWHSSGIALAVGLFVVMAGVALLAPSIAGMVTMLAPKKASGTSSVMMSYMMFGSSAVMSPVMGRLVDAYDWAQSFAILGSAFILVTMMVIAIRWYFHRQNMIYHINHPKSKKQPYIL